MKGLSIFAMRPLSEEEISQYNACDEMIAWTEPHPQQCTILRDALAKNANITPHLCATDGDVSKVIGQHLRCTD